MLFCWEMGRTDRLFAPTWGGFLGLRGSSLRGNTDVSVIIINYNSAAFTRECLRTIFENTRHSKVEVIVVDNASNDGCGEFISVEFPEVIFVQSNRNLGFAGANNLGSTMARGKYLLFLNPDTEIRGEAIDALCAFMDSMVDAGLAGAHLLNSDGSTQTTCITAFPSIANQVFGFEYLRKRTPRSRLWGMKALFDNPGKPVTVDAISGACMLARREAFEQVMGFTTDYFMYGEDLDLCLKITKAGWKVYYVPEAAVVHHGGQSSVTRAEDNYADVMIRHSMYRFMQLHRGRLTAVMFKIATGVFAVGRMVVLFGFVPAAVIPSCRRFVLRGWRKWTTVFGWCLGLHNWVEQQHTKTFVHDLTAPGTQ